MTGPPLASQPMSAPRVVLDTNVCLDLFVFADPRTAALADQLDAGQVCAVTRDDCRAEWQRVLRYPALKLDEAARARHLARYDACLLPLTGDQRPDPRLPRCKDPDDQKFLELAAQAQAAALLTRDAALLALARHTRRDGLFDILMPQQWPFGPGS